MMDINHPRSICPGRTSIPAASRAIDSSALSMTYTVTIWRRPPIHTVRYARLDSPMT